MAFSNRQEDDLKQGNLQAFVEKRFKTIKTQFPNIPNVIHYLGKEDAKPDEKFATYSLWDPSQGLKHVFMKSRFVKEDMTLDDWKSILNGWVYVRGEYPNIEYKALVGDTIFLYDKAQLKAEFSYLDTGFLEIWYEADNSQQVFKIDYFDDYYIVKIYSIDKLGAFSSKEVRSCNIDKGVPPFGTLDNKERKHDVNVGVNNGIDDNKDDKHPEDVIKDSAKESKLKMELSETKRLNVMTSASVDNNTTDSNKQRPLPKIKYDCPYVEEKNFIQNGELYEMNDNDIKQTNVIHYLGKIKIDDSKVEQETANNVGSSSSNCPCSTYANRNSTMCRRPHPRCHGRRAKRQKIVKKIILTSAIAAVSIFAYKLFTRK